jgi:hypothetical protein
MTNVVVISGDTDDSQPTRQSPRDAHARVVRHFLIAAAVELCWLLYLFWMTLR